ncbi:TPA: hypothetical protein HA242_05870 [Candidatus Woesearchaeota archaeon]|nr:hypothetical protein [Candidatus Woesearchaeota archaeon]
METRYSNKIQTEPLWNTPYSPRLRDELLEETRLPKMIHDPQQLKSMHPALTALLEQTPGTRIELEVVEFDRTSAAPVYAQPSLRKSRGYLLVVKSYGHSGKFDGPHIETQYEDSFGIIESIPLLRHFNAQESLQALPKRRELTVGSKRFHQLSKYLIGQPTRILRWEDKTVVFHNQSLEEQLAEFEAGLRKREN